jgi:hypothetical protein
MADPRTPLEQMTFELTSATSPPPAPRSSSRAALYFNDPADPSPTEAAFNSRRVRRDQRATGQAQPRGLYRHWRSRSSTSVPARRNGGDTTTPQDAPAHSEPNRNHQGTTIADPPARPRTAPPQDTHTAKSETAGPPMAEQGGVGAPGHQVRVGPSASLPLLSSPAPHSRPSNNKKAGRRSSSGMDLRR